MLEFWQPERLPLVMRSFWVVMVESPVRGSRSSRWWPTLEILWLCYERCPKYQLRGELDGIVEQEDMCFSG